MSDITTRPESGNGNDGSIPNLQPHQTLYGYVPTKWICGLFIALFALTTLIHIFQATRYRLWWLFPTIVVGGVCEVLGWAGRLWSSFEPRQLNPYLMQICTTILAPSWMSAANFAILGIIIRLLGPQYSWLSPRMYLIVFLTLDLIALVGQAVGGAQASIAAETGRDPTPGGNIMCYFIIVQMGAISLYTICQVEFLIRYHLNKPVRHSLFFSETPKIDQGQGAQGEEGEPGAGGSGSGDATGSNNPVRRGGRPRQRITDNGIKLMLVGMGISTLFILIRSVYRTIELLDGWSGRIITTQLYFNVLDGGAIVVAMFAINIFHPGFLLQDNAKTMGRKPKPALLKEQEEQEGEKTEQNN